MKVSGLPMKSVWAAISLLCTTALASGAGAPPAHTEAGSEHPVIAQIRQRKSASPLNRFKGKVSAFRGLSDVNLNSLQLRYDPVLYARELWIARKKNYAIEYAVSGVDTAFQRGATYEALLLSLQTPVHLLVNTGARAGAIDLNKVDQMDISPLVKRIGVIRVGVDQMKDIAGRMPATADRQRQLALARKIAKSKFTNNFPNPEQQDFSDPFVRQQLLERHLFVSVATQVEKNNPAFIQWIDVSGPPASLRHDHRVTDAKLSHVGAAKVVSFPQANNVSFVVAQHRAATGRFEREAPVSLSISLWGGEQEIVVGRDGTVDHIAYGDGRMGPIRRSITKVAPAAAAQYVELQHARLKAGERTDAVVAFDELAKLHSIPSN